jgi:hypothetical protein
MWKHCCIPFKQNEFRHFTKLKSLIAAIVGVKLDNKLTAYKDDDEM